jgi:hypothetical protein
MGKTLKSFVLGLLVAVSVLAPLHAQTTIGAPAAANTSPAGQAPDDVMKKLSELVGAGKYTEAQQLTTGLLAAYPDDQRLIKAKALLDKSLAAASAKAIPNADPSASDSVPTPAAGTVATQLTGMDKVDYNALIQRAREAQQTTDLAQQKVLLKQFMDDSSQFLKKYPQQMLLWQLRSASAVSLDDITAGYEAGQKLLAMGAADSNDSNLQQLLAQLKNKGWLGKGAAEKAQKQAEETKIYGWTSGTWNAHHSEIDKRGNVITSASYDGVAFVRHGSVLEGYMEKDSEKLFFSPVLRITILDSGEIRCEGSRSCGLSNHNKTITIVSKDGKSNKENRDTLVLHKN